MLQLLLLLLLILTKRIIKYLRVGSAQFCPQGKSSSNSQSSKGAYIYMRNNKIFENATLVVPLAALFRVFSVIHDFTFLESHVVTCHIAMSKRPSSLWECRDLTWVQPSQGASRSHDVSGASNKIAPVSNDDAVL